MDERIIKAVYVYPGWHREDFRRDDSGNILNEWDLVINAKPYFKGHRQPRRPLNIYDDSLNATSEWQISLAGRFGIDAFIYCFYWSFGKRVLYKPLDEAFLNCTDNQNVRFAIMWANRMPRGILPVKRTREPLIHPSRFVYTDREDFLSLIRYAAENYFTRPNYLKIGNRYLFSIFDSAFFLRDTGFAKGREIILSAREWLKKNGFGDLYLIALNPAPAFIRSYKSAGFDAVSHYVYLPDWKGEYIQDYKELISKRASEWRTFATESELTYFPSVSPCWDATPRGKFREGKIPKRYPYWPVVTGESPFLFRRLLQMACDYNRQYNNEKIIFIASMNEYSEGHYIEPDEDFGYGFLEGVRDVR